MTIDQLMNVLVTIMLIVMMVAIGIDRRLYFRRSSRQQRKREDQGLTKQAPI
jgi:hypothetical protein